MSLATQFDAEVCSAVRHINNNSPYARFRITTMTILLKAPQKGVRLNLENFNHWLEQCSSSNVPNGWSIHAKPGFYNCIIFRKTSELDNNLNSGNRKKHKCIAIKIFSNGNLHITGSQSVQDAIHHGHVVTSIFSRYLHHTTLTDCAYTHAYSTFDIQLMNGCFKLDIPNHQILCLKTLSNLVEAAIAHPKINGCCLKSCIFNNDHHPGVRLKFSSHSHTCSILIFKSGSILINAFTSGPELLQAFNFITQFFDTHKSSLLLEQSHGPSKKRKHDIESFDYSKFV